MMTIGDKIRMIRSCRGFTQVKLAEMTGIHPVSIRKYETNKMQPLTPQIEKIAEALQVNAAAITGTSFSARPITTVGDLMGLLLTWLKAGIVAITGTRQPDHRLDPATIELIPSPVFSQLFEIHSPKLPPKIRFIPWNGLAIDITNVSILMALQHWEVSCYHIQKCTDSLNAFEPGSPDYDDYAEEIERRKYQLEFLELELQSSNTLLSECTKDTSLQFTLLPFN